VAYSLDFRKQVIKSLDECMTYAQAVEFYELSTSTMHSWRQILEYKKARDKALTQIPDNALLQDVKAYPDDYKYEHANRLGCSKTSIHHDLKCLGISQKKTLEHPKACPIKKAKYSNHLSDYMIQDYPIVYMDESGFDAETIRPYGYAPIGKPCIDRYNWQDKKRTNVIGALYERVLFALDYFEKNINREVFYHWCKHTLSPSLKSKYVIVMDMSKDKELLCARRRICLSDKIS